MDPPENQWPPARVLALQSWAGDRQTCLFKTRAVSEKSRKHVLSIVGKCPKYGTWDHRTEITAQRNGGVPVEDEFLQDLSHAALRQSNGSMGQSC